MHGIGTAIASETHEKLLHLSKAASTEGVIF
jgi:hypothetical protein